MPAPARARGSALEELLAGQIRLLGANIPAAPVREHQFHPGRRWRFDFAWPDHMLAVEVEGGTWTAGRHSRGAAFEADCEKYAEAVIAGWRILRVTNHMVEDGRALAFIERALDRGDR